jgi:hypothetical protein
LLLLLCGSFFWHRPLFFFLWAALDPALSLFFAWKLDTQIFFVSWNWNCLFGGSLRCSAVEEHIGYYTGGKKYSVARARLATTMAAVGFATSELIGLVCLSVRMRVTWICLMLTAVVGMLLKQRGVWTAPECRETSVLAWQQSQSPA